MLESFSPRRNVQEVFLSGQSFSEFLKHYEVRMIMIMKTDHLVTYNSIFKRKFKHKYY